MHLLIWNTKNTVYLLWCSCQKCIIDSNHEETSDKSKQKTVYNIINLCSSKCQCPNRERFEELFQIWRNIAIKYNTRNWIESWTKRKKKNVFAIMEIGCIWFLFDPLVKLLFLQDPTQVSLHPLNLCWPIWLWLPCGSDSKESACNAGDPGSIPGLGRSSEEGNGNPLQYCCMENPMDRGASWATLRGVAKSLTRLSD